MIKKIISGTFYTVGALFLLWVFVSWVDIVADNNTADPIHSKYNLFVISSDFGREAQQ